jgi:hypothetical protein
LEQRDSETIRIAAHRIVSASRALGLKRQADAALQIEIWQDGKTDLDWKIYHQLIFRQVGQLSSNSVD